MQSKPATDIYTDEEHAQINEIVESLPEEQRTVPNEEVERLMEETKKKPKKLSEEEFAEIMHGMVNRMTDPNNPHMKRMKDYMYKRTMLTTACFVGTSLGSALMSAYIYRNILQQRNVNLSIILYVSAFILLRTLYVATIYLTADDLSPSMIKFINMSMNIIKILSILAIIFVVGLVAFLDLNLVLACIPYVLIELMILYCYFFECSRCGCSCH